MSLPSLETLQAGREGLPSLESLQSGREGSRGAEETTPWRTAIPRAVATVPLHIAEAVGGGLQSFAEAPQRRREETREALDIIRGVEEPAAQKVQSSLERIAQEEKNEFSADDTWTDTFLKGVGKSVQAASDLYKWAKDTTVGKAYDKVKAHTRIMEGVRDGDIPEDIGKDFLDALGDKDKLEAVGEKLKAYDAEMKDTFSESVVRKIAGEAGDVSGKYWREAAAKVRPKTAKGTAKYYVTAAIEGVGSSLGVGAAVTALTRSPELGLASMYPLVYGQTFSALREQGISPAKAGAQAQFNSIAEIVSEGIPLGIITRVGGKLVTKTLKGMSAEAIQESINEAMQIAYEMGVLDEDTPAQEIGQSLWDAGIIGGIGGGGAAVLYGGLAKKPPSEPIAPDHQAKVLSEITKGMEAGVDSEGAPFTEEKAIAIMQAGKDAGILTDEALEKVRAAHPSLREEREAVEETGEVGPAEESAKVFEEALAKEERPKQSLTGAERLRAKLKKEEAEGVEEAPIETEGVAKLPVFKRTEDALEFGRTATEEEVAVMAKALDAHRKAATEALKSKNTDLAFDEAMQAQYYRESITEAEKAKRGERPTIEELTQPLESQEAKTTEAEREPVPPEAPAEPLPSPPEIRPTEFRAEEVAGEEPTKPKKAEPREGAEKETWESELAKTYKQATFPEPGRWDDFKAFSKKAYDEGFPVTEHFEAWMAKPKKAKPHKPDTIQAEGTEEASLPPKEQKKYLIDEINKAIDEAQVEDINLAQPERDHRGQVAVTEAARATRANIETAGSVSIHIPGDGDFTVLNTKKALSAFKDMARSFPVDIPKSIVKASKPRATKGKGRRIDNFEGWYYNEFQPRTHKAVVVRNDADKNSDGFYGDGFFSDGNYLVKVGEKPKTKLPVKELPASIKEIATGKKPTKGLAKAEIAGETFMSGPESVPTVHVVTKGAPPRHYEYKAEYFDSILTRFPDATLSVDRDHYAFFKKGHEIVGMVAPRAGAGELGSQESISPEFHEARERRKRPVEATRKEQEDEIPIKAATKQGPDKEQIEDVGEKLGGARKDLARQIKSTVADDEIAAHPLSKIWPKPKLEDLDNSLESAFLFAARAEIPSKPQTGYKLKRWAEQVRTLREVAEKLLSGNIDKDKLRTGLKDYVHNQDFHKKIEVLQKIDKSLWDKVDRFRYSPDAFSYDKEGKKEASPHLSVNGRIYRYEKDTDEAIPEIEKDLRELSEKPKSKTRFEVRGSVGLGYFINKKGDPEYRKLKEFKTSKEALDYRNANHEALVDEWEKVKASDNIHKTDVRNKINKARTGKDHRGGKDVGAEEFRETFGFRGVEFGLWVKQGKASKERQGMINAAYDAFLDLSAILDLPPQAISLNGSLGLGLGSRGHGWASAHFEPSAIVINLTKPRGAGSLAHEWFHAVDNYFQRARGAGRGREENFITYRPEAGYKNKKTGQTLTVRSYKHVSRNHEDWERVEGVRPEVEKVFADLVKVLDESGMHKRATKIDTGKKDGYWSRIIERAARAFENYVIGEMEAAGYNNDYLANVTQIEDFQKNLERYPYLTADELAPVKEAFDNLFKTIKTKKTEKGTALYATKKTSHGKPLTSLETKSIFSKMKNVESGVDEDGNVWFRVKDQKKVTINEVDEVKGYLNTSSGPVPIGSYFKNIIELKTSGVGPTADESTIFHEFTHYLETTGLLPGKDIDALNKAIAKSNKFDVTTPEDVTAEHRAEFIQEAIPNRATNESLAMRRILQRIADFFNAFYEIAARTRTARGVTRDIERGEIKPEARQAALFEGTPLFQMAGPEEAKQFSTKPPPETPDEWAKRTLEGIMTKADKKVGSLKKIPLKPESKQGIVDAQKMDSNPTSPEGFNMPTQGKGMQALDLIQWKLQDRLNHLKKVQSAIETQESIELPDDANVYQAEELYHYKTTERIEAADRDLFDPLIESIHDSGHDLEDVELFLRARHAPEANSRLQRINPKRTNNQALSGMSNAEAAKVMGKYGANKAMLDIVGKIDAITKKTRETMVSEGLATKEEIAAWEGAYKYYVPLMREKKGASMPKKGRGASIGGKEAKRRLTGSEELKPVNIIANIMSQHEATLIRAEKAKVGRAMLKLATEHPNKDLWEADAPELKPFLKQRADNAKQLDPTTGLPVSLGEVVYGRDILYKLNDNVLVTKIDGVEHTVTFNEQNVHSQRIVKALKNLGADNSNAALNVLSKINRVLAIVNTSANPEFILSNFARDIQTAGYNINDTEAKGVKVKIFKDVFKALQGIRQGVRGEYDSEWAQRYRSFQKAGAQTGWIDYYKDVESREKALKKKLSLLGEGNWVATKRAMESAFEFVSNENTAVENAIRLSTYHHLKTIGLSDAKAASTAKNLTVNFNRRGDAGHALNALYLFYNASIQGSVRLIYAATKSPTVRKMMVGTVGFAVMLDLLNRAVGGEDDDGEKRYDKVDDWVKEHNLIIMRPSGSYFKLPLPWGYNTLHVLGQTIGEAIDPSTSKKFSAISSAARLGAAVIGSFNPLGSESSLLQLITPTIIDPFVQWAENQNFAGIPLRPEQNPFDVPKPEYQLYFRNAREPSKWIAKQLNDLTGGDAIKPGAINISPEVFDLFIDTVTGGAGRFLDNTLNLPKTVTSEDVDVRKLPFVRRLYGEPSEFYLRTKFYDNLSEIRYAEKSLKHYKNIGDLEGLIKAQKANVKKVPFIDKAKKTTKTIKGLRDKQKRSEALNNKAAVNMYKWQIRNEMARFNKFYLKK